ncbi:MAG: DUF3343 domain-containing protein [Armatimonadota bacterium]
MSRYGVILFLTSSAAFRAECVLKEAGFECVLIPTPRAFSSDCGVAGRFDWSRADEVTQVVRQAGIEMDTVHPMPA